MNKKSSKISTFNENYSHLELVNLGKIFFKEKKFIDFRSKGNRSGFEAIKDINLKIEKNTFVSIIGPSGCGKSTLAKHLSAKTGAQIISTDEIRKNLYGDDSRQGDWDEVEEIMHEKIINSISNNQAVIVDATFAKRPWRLEITQNLPLMRRLNGLVGDLKQV